MLGLLQRLCTHAHGARTGTRDREPAWSRAHWLTAGACFLSLSACDDQEAAPTIAQDRGHELDAGLVQTGDAGDAAPHVKLINVGAPCSLHLGACAGEAAQCLDVSLSGAFYTGGYCTADCRSSAECGPEGECPVGDSELLDPDYDFRSTWARKCFKSCSPDEPDACRVGYACMSLADAYLAPDAPMPLHHNVCIPHAPLLIWDGSLPGLGDPAHDGGSAR